VVGLWIDTVEPVLDSTKDDLVCFVYSYLTLASVGLSYEQAFKLATVEWGAKLPHLMSPQKFHVILEQLGDAIDASCVDDPFHKFRGLENKLYGAMADLFKLTKGRYGIGQTTSKRKFNPLPPLQPDTVRKEE
jgi:hypothetical protein